MKNIKFVKDELTLKAGRVKNKVINILSNERGDGIITGLIFTAILVIAVLAMNGSIKSAFASLGTWFETAVVEKVKTALN